MVHDDGDRGDIPFVAGKEGGLQHTAASSGICC